MPSKRADAKRDAAETIDIESRLAPFFDTTGSGDTPAEEQHSPEQ